MPADAHTCSVVQENNQPAGLAGFYIKPIFGMFLFNSMIRSTYSFFQELLNRVDQPGVDFSNPKSRVYLISNINYIPSLQKPDNI